MDEYLGEIVDSSFGSCLKIETRYPSPIFSKIPEEEVRTSLLYDLTLVPGIGPVRARELQRKGKNTISNLYDTKWGDDAMRVVEIIENGSINEILDFYSSIQRRSNPNLLRLVNERDMLFFDIETLGMWNAPIVIFGCGKCVDNKIEVTQYLIRNLEEEYSALMHATDMLNRASSIVSYNGRIFDIPYVNNRLRYYGEKSLKEKVHMDLLYPTRKIFRNKLSDCRLESVESAIPSLNRGEEEIPGALVPYYYSCYMSTRRVNILYPIVEHNRLDVANLAYLLDFEQKYNII